MQVLKKRLKNEKGLTLMELLAVLVILGIIAAIAVPSVLGTIEKSKRNADKATLLVIKDAGLRWALENQAKNGDTKKVSELIDEGYLNDTPKVQSGVIQGFDHIKVVKDQNNQYKFTIEVYETATSPNPIDESIFDN